jgi:cytochrome c oxidase subunit 3
MWTFLASEVLFFGALLMAYTFVRVLHPLDFLEAAKHTNIWFGTANTFILITSSFTMVMAVRAADLDLGRMASILFAVTAALGLLFLVVKGFEYREDLHEHLLPGRNFALPQTPAQIFFSFYWGITGLHAVHLSIGIGLVSRLAYLAARRRIRLDSPQIEVTALYWGLVDIVWIVVFPLLYLGGRA